ncbi:MAG TPA: VOC family protein [Thermoplasmata archaeon]|nr:VOC family protein [Thermoplasmata archaeon]
MVDVIEGLEGVTVHVRDLARSRAFYSGVLGLQEVEGPPDSPRAAFRIPGTSALLSMHVMGEGEGGREPGTVSGILFSHHDPAAAFAEIRKRGGTVVREPHTFEAALGTVALGVFSDPDGNEFVLRHVLSNRK